MREVRRRRAKESPRRTTEKKRPRQELGWRLGGRTAEKRRACVRRSAADAMSTMCERYRRDEAERGRNREGGVQAKWDVKPRATHEGSLAWRIKAGGERGGLTEDTVLQGSMHAGTDVFMEGRANKLRGGGASASQREEGEDGRQKRDRRVDYCTTSSPDLPTSLFVPLSLLSLGHNNVNLDHAAHH